MEWLGDFWTWAWARHHNPLSWYIRPLFVLPFCYFAYRKSVGGLVLTVVGVLSSMFWFPAPSDVDPRAAAFLAMEQQYVTGGWTWTKTFMTLLVPIWFVLLAGAFWRKSWIVGIWVINVGAALKVVWSFYFGGGSAWSIIAPVAVGALVCNGVLAVLLRRRRSTADPPSDSGSPTVSGGATLVVLVAIGLAGCEEATEPVVPSVLGPVAFGTVQLEPDGSGLSIAPVAGVHSSYYRDAEATRTIRRGVVEFDLAELPPGCSGALILTEGTRGISIGMSPPDTHDIYGYEGDGSLSTGDFSVSGQRVATFATDLTEPLTEHVIDLGPALTQHAGRILGLRVQLRGDTALTVFFEPLGAGFDRALPSIDADCP